jgi:hypothetical protein
VLQAPREGDLDPRAFLEYLYHRFFHGFSDADLTQSSIIKYDREMSR